jgi:hypothetical protein
VHEGVDFSTRTAVSADAKILRGKNANRECSGVVVTHCGVSFWIGLTSLLNSRVKKVDGILRDGDGFQHVSSDDGGIVELHFEHLTILNHDAGDVLES